MTGVLGRVEMRDGWVIAYEKGGRGVLAMVRIEDLED